MSNDVINVVEADAAEMWWLWAALTANVVVVTLVGRTLRRWRRRWVTRTVVDRC